MEVEGSNPGMGAKAFPKASAVFRTGLNLVRFLSTYYLVLTILAYQTLLEQPEQTGKLGVWGQEGDEGVAHSSTVEKGAQNSIDPKSKVIYQVSSQGLDQGIQRRDGCGQVNGVEVCSSNFSLRLRHFSNRGLCVSYSYIYWSNICRAI